MKPAFSSPVHRLFLLALVSTAALVKAEDVTTSDGKIYLHVKVSGETPESVKLIHEGGITTIAKKLLPAAFMAQHELAAPPQASSSENAQDRATQLLLEAFQHENPVFASKDGHEFRSADITQVDPSGIKLKTGDGIVRVKFADLPLKIKAAFHFDPLKAGKYEAEEESRRLAGAANIKKLGNIASTVDTFSTNARLLLIQNLGSGWICGVETLATVDGRAQPVVVGTVDRMMIFGLPSYASLTTEMQQRKAWSGKIYRIGNYLSEDAHSGRQTKILAAHTDRATAVQWLAKNGNAMVYTANGNVEGDTVETKGGTYTGTGFAISTSGHIATAAHVVEDAADINVKIDDVPVEARVVAIDKARDVAIIKVSSTKLKPLRLEKAERVKLGGDLFCVGYPLVGRLGVNAKLTKGQLNAQSGLLDDSGTFQMSVQIQPGNSGGPVCNGFGQVVGVVSKTSSTIAGASGQAGAVPQNVNFATKADALIELAGTVSDLALATGIGYSDLSAEDRVLASTYLITTVVR